jgi:hypothetical protein
MSLIDSKAAFGIWCALMLGASGQDGALNSGDRLREETAARLREFSKNNNMGGPRRPISPELNAVNSTVLENLGAGDLEKMSLDDPVLKSAYVEVFLRSWGAFKQLEPPQELALADMRRRGEAVSTMLLKLISENQENRIEDAILIRIEHLDTVRIEPFLEYARRLLRERTQTMTGEAAGAAAYILARHGTKEDEALFEEVIKVRPYVKYTFTKELNVMRARLNPKPEVDPGPRPERREIPSTNVGSIASPAKDAENHHHKDEGDTLSRTKPWFIGGLILVVLLGLYRLLRNGRRGNSA